MLLSPTKMLAKFVVDLKFQDVPSDVIDLIKLDILDTIGCALHGSTTPWGKKTVELITDCGGKREAIIWGYPNLKTSPPDAALANGTHVHAFELDDNCGGAVMHAGGLTLPAALAIAEQRRGVSGRDLLTAIVAGTELGIRVGLTVNPRANLLGWHTPGSIGTFLAAASAGKIMGLNEEKMLHALGTAGSLGSGLMASQYSSDVKRFHVGRASQSGVVGALLAEKSFKGISNILEAPYGGFCSTMTAGVYDLRKLTNNLGRQYVTLNNLHFKAHPWHGLIHSPLETWMMLRDKHHIDLQKIRKITVRGTESMKIRVGWKYEPVSVMSAQANLYYCLARMILEGEVDIEQFSEEKIKDPKILNYMKKIKVMADEKVTDLFDTRLEVELTDGKRISYRNTKPPKGFAGNRMSKDEVIAKFMRLSAFALKKGRAQEIKNTIDRLENLDDVTVLSNLLKS